MMLSDAQKAKQGDSAAQASGCYIPAGAHWTRSECWVMLRHPLHLIGYVKFEKFASASNQCMLFAHANCASGNTWDAKMFIGWAWAHGWINGWMKRLQGGAIKEGLNARVEVHHYSFLPNLTCIPVSVCRILSSTFFACSKSKIITMPGCGKPNCGCGNGCTCSPGCSWVLQFRWANLIKRCAFWGEVDVN